MESGSTEIRSKEIQLVNINELIPYEKNMNSHSPEQIDRLCKLIEYQGFRDPLIVQRGTNRIACGHGRWECAKKLGMVEVPVIYQEFESEEQFYSFVVSHNAIAEWSILDLGQINTDIIDLGPELDIEMLGLKDFEVEPLDRLDPQSDEDAVPEVEHPITRRGDVWLLGNHRAMCGDSTMIDDVDKLMAGEKADMVFTDPPYGISLGFETPEQAKARNRRTDGLVVKNDDLQDGDLQELLTDSLALSTANLKSGGAFYICSPIDKEVRKFIQACEDNDLHYQSGLVWNKSSLCLSRHDYHPKHEIIHYGWKKGAAHNWYADRKQTSVYDFDKPSRSENHPTSKPVDLVSYYIGNVSKSGNLVIDSFLGSGSTLIACEKTNRKCYGMELDEKYCDVIIKRWEEYTGNKATLEATGQTYAELRVERDDDAEPNGIKE